MFGPVYSHIVQFFRPILTQHTGRNWLNAEIVESCEGVRCRPARSSADVCQRGSVRQRMGGGKVPTTPFRDQVVNLQALPSEEADPALALLCPVRALCIYMDRTRSVRSSEQLFVCHGGQQKGKAVSKQRLAHWIVEAVALA